MLGEFLPDEDQHQKLKDSEIWRVFCGYFPGAFFVITFLGFTFVIKHDSIKNLVTTGKIKEAKEHLKLVYKNCNDNNVDTYVAYIRSKSGRATSTLTLKDAFTNPRYRRATWVNVGYIIFHELTGINVIMQFSNQIFKKM